MEQSQQHIPISTYRLQFNHSFTFNDATKQVPYFHALGITHCYASPYLKAVPGSLHGYDVVDPASLNPEIGSKDDYQKFVQVLKTHGMGHILDVVPNHMGITHPANLWWQDVLENGPSSRYAKYFDIDWAPVKEELEDKVLLPILGDQYGIVLENQEIRLCFKDGVFYLQYFENRLPLDPGTWELILSFRLEELAEALPETDAHLQELKSIITSLLHLPQRTEDDPQRIEERYREKEVISRRLLTLTQESPSIASFLQENLLQFNGIKGNYSSFDRLDDLVSNQAYRLAYWRVAAEEINYRRFFDINELAAIRIEESEVFNEIHQLVLQFLQEGSLTGIRIDHVDGLYDPRAYLRQWQLWAEKHLSQTADAKGRFLFILVEKILGKNEPLSEDWPTHGTTGYDFLALLNNIFVQTENRRAFDQIYARFIKHSFEWDDLVYRCKELIMSSSMSSEINALGHQLNLLSERNRRTRDFTLNSLIHAVREIIACFPVYRTYVTPPPSEEVMDRDRAYIRLAVARAKRRNPAVNNLVFDFIRTLLLKLPGEGSEWNWDDACPFVMKFQQTTSPVMAKGAEDTAFYIYNRLVSLNEVGGEPEQFGIPLPTFHERISERQLKWPHGLSATSTHDTKRGEDIRARLNVLSEIPKEWRKHLALWHRLNKKAKTTIEDQIVPDRNEEYLLYQTLLGCWPCTDLDDQGYQEITERIQNYMTKALREAKVHTSWLNPDDSYESGVRSFIAAILTRPRQNAFLNDFLPFQQELTRYGFYNSLSQVLLKITAPGIPDFYQGTELWDLNLVDPDNRRPVNYEHRHQLLEEMKSSLDPEEKTARLRMALENPLDGRIKFLVTMSALQFRQEQAPLFLYGSYHPLETYGQKSQHLCAFARMKDGEISLTLIPRFFTGLVSDPTTLPIGKAVWEDTGVLLPPECAGSHFQEILTGGLVSPEHQEGKLRLPAASVFEHFPGAILKRSS